MRKVLLATVVLALGAAALSPANSSQVPSARPRVDSPAPNVVLFVVDDMTAEDLDYMPRTQRLLVARGTNLTRNYSPFPLCCPARATILTGLYPHNHGVLDNVRPEGGFTAFEDHTTVATLIDDDYATGFTGKYFNDYAKDSAGRRYVPPGWDDWMASVEPGTYDFLRQTLNVNGRLVPRPGVYSTRLFGQMGREFLSEHDTSGQPMFLYEAFVAPHGGAPRDPDDTDGVGTPYVEARYRDTYAGPTMTSDPSYNEADVSDKTAPYFETRQAPLTPAEEAATAESLVQRRESLRTVDDEIAATLARLRELRELSSTYVILVSDNGYNQGQHRISSGKNVPYESAARVPLVIRGPGIPVGLDFEGVTGLQDLTPSILRMTNQLRDQANPDFDGRSLVPLITGARSTGRAQLIEIAKASTTAIEPLPPSAAPLHPNSGTVAWQVHGIVTQDGWKYVEYPRTGAVEMYDLNADPYEMGNLSADSAYADKREELAQVLARYRWCDGAECRR